MISLQLRRLLNGGKGFFKSTNWLYSSGPKQRNGAASEIQGSVHLPNNVEKLDAGQKALFSPERARDISGPNIDSHFQGANLNSASQGKHQAGEDAHVGAYACSGCGIHLNSVMQPNVPLPFESAAVSYERSSEVGVGELSSYVDNPPEGGHWTGGEKYLAEDRKNVHERGDGREGGGNGSQPGTAPLTGRRIVFMIGSLPMTCCGLATPPINHILMWQYGNVLASNQAYGIRSLLPMNSTPYLTYSTSMNNGNINVAPLSRKDKLKKAVKDYGATVIVFHVGISLLSLGGFYLAVSSGLNVMDILDKVGLGEKAVAKEASTFAVAYIVHKALAPVRISITLTATPFIVHYLRRIGFLKPPK